MPVPDRPNLLPPTNEDTVGPYYPVSFCRDDRMDLTQAAEGVVAEIPGRRIELRGRVLDRFGDLANGVLLEFWQANAAGLHRTPETAHDPRLDPFFDGFARCRSADGRFALRTVMPGRRVRRLPHRHPHGGRGRDPLLRRPFLVRTV